MKEYCRYGVTDIETGVVLITGEKWKDVSDLVPMGSFRSGFFGLLGRKIVTYARIAEIKGRYCLIEYFTGSPQTEVGSCVTISGRLLGLSGKWYDSQWVR